ncbi:MAG TPA: multiheme c-type cytochrome, partial [Acidobacteriota bacterium]|nr:multiheme c-type cytochrome [Acidobacteriota bacterium]
MLLETLYKNPGAQKIAAAMGEKLIKVDSLCLTCHFTPKQMGTRLSATAGVSCESCHGAAKDWVGIHNDYGGPQFNHDTEPPEHKKERLAKAAAAGMFPPEQIYLLAGNCFSCHTVQNEKLVNVGGHSTGSSFDLADRIDQIRHNFVRAGRNVNAPINPNDKRVMYVVGWELELEYGLRGAAKSVEDGRFIQAMAGHVRSALAELRSIKAAMSIPEVDEALNAAQGLSIKPNNETELLHAADKVRLAGKTFVEKNDGSKLAALDQVMSGGGGEEESTQTAGAAGESASATGAAGQIPRHARPPASHKTLGPGCGCHG